MVVLFECVKNDLPKQVVFLMGGGLNPPGYRSAPVTVVCRFVNKLKACFKTRTLGDTARKNNPPDCFCFTNPTSHARRSHNPKTIDSILHPHRQNKDRHPNGCLSLLGAGAGFEPTTSGL